MHWVWPIQVLLLGAVLGLGLGCLGWHAARRRRQVLAVWTVTPGSSWARGGRPARCLLRDLAWVGAWLLVLVALARPQFGTAPLESELVGTVVLAVDTSASMRAADELPSRLALATQWVQDVAAQLPCCRLGLISFAGDAQVLCPPTEDHGIFRDLLAGLADEPAVREGSELGPALALCRTLLERAGGGVLIVVTDGEYHDRDPGAALSAPHRSPLELVTVTVGGPVAVPVPGLTPGTVVSDPRHGGAALTAARPEAMRELARASDGLAIVAASPAGMAAAVRFIEERLVRRDAPAVGVRRVERYQWPVSAALLLLILRLVTPWGIGVRAGAPAGRRLDSVWAAVVVLSLANVSAADPDASARIAAWRQASLQAPGHDRPRCLYNLALALQENGQAGEARRTYVSALALPGGPAAMRARCLNNLGVLALQEGENAAASAADAALAAFWRAQSAFREALRLDPRLEVARRNLQEAGAQADRLQAHLAAAPSESSGPAPGQRAPATGDPAAAEPSPTRSRAALPATGSAAAPRGTSRRGVPVEDGAVLERLCHDAGSADEFLQILKRGTSPARRPATLPW